MSGPRPLHRRLLDRIEMAAARLVQAISLALPGEAWAQSAGAAWAALEAFGAYCQLAKAEKNRKRFNNELGDV